MPEIQHADLTGANLHEPKAHTHTESEVTDLHGHPAVYAVASGSHAYLSGQHNIAEFSSATEEGGEFWDAGQPSRLTIPEPGLYEFGGAIQAGNTSHNAFTTIGLYKNGSSLGLNHSWPVYSDTFTGTTGRWEPVRCQAGDYFEMRGWSNWAGTASVRFWCRKVAD